MCYSTHIATRKPTREQSHDVTTHQLSSLRRDKQALAMPNAITGSGMTCNGVLAELATVPARSAASTSPSAHERCPPGGRKAN